MELRTGNARLRPAAELVHQLIKHLHGSVDQEYTLEESKKSQLYRGIQTSEGIPPKVRKLMILSYIDIC